MVAETSDIRQTMILVIIQASACCIQYVYLRMYVYIYVYIVLCILVRISCKACISLRSFGISGCPASLPARASNCSPNASKPELQTFGFRCVLYFRRPQVLEMREIINYSRIYRKSSWPLCNCHIYLGYRLASCRLSCSLFISYMKRNSSSNR